jgi:RNA polymerase sigma-70 factor (ECF subfamily)
MTKAVMERESDWANLMSRAQSGDGTAYAALLRETTPWLRALARKAGTETDDVEDAVQDILLTVHNIRHTFDPARPFAPWLQAIARHRLIDRARSRGRRRRRELPLEDHHETIAAPETNSHETESEARRLRAAVATLPEGQRQAVELLRMQELSVREAAARSGQSETALKVALHRAVKRLRSVLEGK